jgi:hypothetical protein
LSTILKALRRVEDARKAQAPKPLREEVTGSAPAASGRASWLTAGLALVAGVAVGIGVLWWWPRGGEREAPGELAAAARTEAAAESTARVRPARVQRPDPPRTVPPADVTPRPPRSAPPGDASLGLAPHAIRPDLPRNLPEPSEAEPFVSEPIASPRPAPVAVERVERVPAPLPRAPERAEQPPAPAPAQETPDVAALERAEPAPVRRPEPAAVGVREERLTVEPERAEPIPEPGLAPEPPTTRLARSPVPEIAVSQTIWHPRAERRLAVVMVAGVDGALRLHEGDAVGLLVVEAIEPSGVVFRHEGVQLRRRVGQVP